MNPSSDIAWDYYFWDCSTLFVLAELLGLQNKPSSLNNTDVLILYKNAHVNFDSTLNGITSNIISFHALISSFGVFIFMALYPCLIPSKTVICSIVRIIYTCSRFIFLLSPYLKPYSYDNCTVRINNNATFNILLSHCISNNWRTDKCRHCIYTFKSKLTLKIELL